jgi:uncharacterized protein (TIGR00255 family)
VLLSMTGFGEARCQQEGLGVAIEVRAINSRFFKLSVRAGEGYASLEPRIEEVVRQSIRRGTIQVNVRIDRLASPDDFRIKVAVLGRYREQIQSLYDLWKLAGPLSIADLLPLPGVVDDHSASALDLDHDWPRISRTLEAALANLAHMREDEGRAMAADLAANCRAIAAGLDQIAHRAPLMVDAYRSRLKERLEKVLNDFQVVLDPGDLIREVSLYADRGDISEEIVRLRSHLEQFDTIMGLPESAGRKLEFLTQEMFREANTIGSKANDVEIARHVIEIKTAIERIREMVQNVE